ncbi:MAG: ABC transporter substrate-binding protein [Oscillospiraceae bacterium]|nr:ABC transporter substrate-binding protein [Oscillospiraceae bacterium]
MKNGKKTLAIILSLVMCLMLVAACAPADAPTGQGATGGGEAGSPPVTQPPALPEPPAPPREEANLAEHIEIILDNNQIGVLNPMSPASHTPGTNQTFTMIHDRLLNYNIESGEFLPALATTWHTDDYQTFILTLRDDVYFHNGDHFTAADVVFTVNHALDAAGTNVQAQWSPVETVTALDDYTVEFVLRDLNVDFYFNMTMPMTGMLNERAINEDPDLGAAVGTGAFRLREFVSNDFVTVERNDAWWGGVMPTQSITLRFIPEVAARTIMMQNGEAQICLGIGSEDMRIFTDDPDNFFITLQTVNNPQGISFNMANPITADPYFRRAVVHGINRAEVAIVAAGDWGLPPGDDEGTLWGFQTEFRNNDLPGWAFDQDLARSYLERSSYNGETVEIAAAVITNVRGAEVIQQNLSRIGINVVINQMDAPSLAAHWAAEDNRSQIVFHGFQFTLNSASARHNFVPGGAQNRANYDNAEVTRLLNEAATMTDRDEREATFMRVQELIHDDLVGKNMMWRIFGQVAANGIGGMYFPPDTHWTDFRHVYWDLDA